MVILKQLKIMSLFGNVEDAAELGFVVLQQNVRAKRDLIHRHFIVNYLPKRRPKTFKPRCIFCWSKNKITKEHVMPRWVFEQSEALFFNSTTNNFNFNYNKTSVPVCAHCNNNVLGAIERYIANKFMSLGKIHAPLEDAVIERLIRWFEIMDYKFHAMNMIQRFVKYRGVDFDKKVANLPLSMLRRDATPVQAINQLKRSMKRIGIINKTPRYKSFLQFRTTNKEFHFFHSMDNYMFLELPKHSVAFFYFFRRSFDEGLSAKLAADKIFETSYH
jgi:hypothetical protein